VKLVVALGNPGRKYQGTRHNVGFAVADELTKRHIGDNRKSKFQGETQEIEHRGQKAILLWPHTFMNLSGASALAARDFYKLENNELLVVCDDFNLPLGKLRFRADGSSGGQKGLADVISRLGTELVPRLRVGVGPVPANWDPADFVLSRFTADEQETTEATINQAADAVENWLEYDLTDCMNKFNA
jgi:peptidyl-tRNA hydrolase, PTH1 family